ncbi:hypothetical protein MVEN_02009800 [Mycena venus]|uniref:Uncharacterized protein n=1 Tax=Mycena venus TaxID=2733690 RepID=A0A8H6XB91_9AGAR|nr:hypothetical protein MVEN_02009800 [Mycena venus]
MAFKSPKVDPNVRIWRFMELSRSPYIFSLVLRLEITLNYLESDQFLMAITREMIAIQAFLRLPTVQFVKLYCCFPDISAFLQIWDGCSESISDVMLAVLTGIDSDYDWESSAVLEIPRKVRLDTLDLAHSEFRILLPWLTTDAFPFDLSNLTTLRVYQPHWNTFFPSSTTIKRLELKGDAVQGPIDLSLFPHLQHLELQALRWPNHQNPEMALRMLATIPADNQISHLKIDCRSADVFASLDDLLSAIALPQLNQFELVSEEDVKQALPKLYAQKLSHLVMLDERSV